MTKYRTHYALVGLYTLCGIKLPKNWTTNPVKVTCGNCKRLLGKDVK